MSNFGRNARFGDPFALGPLHGLLHPDLALGRVPLVGRHLLQLRPLLLLLAELLLQLPLLRPAPRSFAQRRRGQGIIYRQSKMFMYVVKIISSIVLSTCLEFALLFYLIFIICVYFLFSKELPATLVVRVSSTGREGREVGKENYNIGTLRSQHIR